MTKLFTGSIGRLLVVASHSGAGKTTFLDNSRQYLDTTNYPPHLEDFHDLTRNHINVTDIVNYKEARFENLCLHVDLSMPIRRHQPRPKNHNELKNLISPTLYERWPDLNQYMRQAEHVDIVIYFVRRDIHFTRWLYDRSLRKNHNRGLLMSVVTAVLGDSTDNWGLHRQVYRAWLEYAKGLESRSMAVIDANADKYKFMEIAEFCHEIENKYES